jgi:D-xylose transport system substrate-binding protein
VFAHYPFKSVAFSLLFSCAWLGLLMASVTAPISSAASIKESTETISHSVPSQRGRPLSLSQPMTVGLSFNNLTLGRWVRDEKVIRQILEDKGYIVISQTANNDSIVQSAQINALVAQGAKAILIVAADTTAIAPTVDAAAQAGVKVISYDRLVRSDQLAAYLSFGGIEVGRQQALGVLQAVNIDGGMWTTTNALKLVKLGGSPTDNSAKIFRQGQDQILQPYIDQGLIDVVADRWVDNWDPANAQIIMENILTTTQNNVQAVVASNDGTALGALQALQAHGLAGMVPISGQDATATGCNSLVKGQLTVSVFKDYRNLAPHAADVIDKLLNGQPVPNFKPYSMAELTNGLYVTGTVMVDFLPAVPVTKDNVYALVVRSGFQAYDDVYLGIPPAQLPPRPMTTVTGVYPATGLETGGTVVTIMGLGYTSGLTVSIGSTLAAQITVADANTVIATTGAHQPGLADVAVYNPNAAHAVLPNGYTYLAVFTTTVTPGVGTVLTTTSGLTTSIEIPGGAVVSPTTVLYAEAITPTGPVGFSFAGQAFDISAYQSGLLVPHFVFAQPVTVALHYRDTDVVGLNESALTLDYWTGSVWADAACGLYDRHLEENWLSVPICHLSEFALFGAPYHVFLPLVRR